MRRLALALVVLVAACGGTEPAATTIDSGAVLERRAVAYAASAWRAVEGTSFASIGEDGLSDLVVELCEGLGVGAIGVAAADTGIDASEDEVAIFLEVLRTGLDQVCEERVVVDLTSLFTRSVEDAVDSAGASAGYDEIAAIRAGPAACRAMRDGRGADAALLEAVFVMYGVQADSVADLSASIGSDQGIVAGAVLAAAAALVCPEHLAEVQALVEGL